MVVALASVLTITAGVSQAQGVFNMPSGQTSLHSSPLGTRATLPIATGYGAVGYVYQMGKYDVTVGQYCQFLNAVAATDTYGLYNSYMAAALVSDHRDYPERQSGQLHLLGLVQRQRVEQLRRLQL